MLAFTRYSRMIDDMPTANDFRYSTPPRTMGSETEYTTQFSLPEDDLQSAIGSQYRLTDEAGVNSDVWLRNGGRAYIDFGDVLEYATPECRNARELMIYERAGETLVADVALKLPEKSLRNGQFQRKAYKRTGYAPVVKGAKILLEPMSAGHHENYHSYAFNHFSESDALYAYLALAAYLASRPVWSGTGIVSTFGYGISQKGMEINFNQKDNPSGTRRGNKLGFSQHNDEARLEIRSGEGNMSEWAIIQKFAFSSLVLRLIEQKKFPEDLMLRVNKSTELLRRMSYQSDSSLLETAAIHQRNIAHCALSLAEKSSEIPSEEIEAAEAVIVACDEILTFADSPDALPLIADRIDWAAKLEYMKSCGIKSETLHTENLDAVMYDLKWEDIAKNGIARQWYKKFQPTTVDTYTSRQALFVPPPTRATARTKILQNLDGWANGIEWARVDASYYDEDCTYSYTAILTDPSENVADEYGSAATLRNFYENSPS